MVRPWRELAARVDTDVDRQFSERVRLVPMLPGSAGEPPSQDPDRQPIERDAILMMLGDQSLGLAGDHAGTPLIERLAVSNILLSITESALGNFDPRQGDRVVLLDPERKGETYEINRVPPAATGRIKMVLIEAPEE